MNIIVTPRSTKTTFITTVIDNNDNHTFINSKQYNISELNALNNKANYFEILHLNIASLSKHTDVFLLYVLSMMEFNF